MRKHVTFATMKALKAHMKLLAGAKVKVEKQVSKAEEIRRVIDRLLKDAGIDAGPGGVQLVEDGDELFVEYSEGA